jgi:farnesyl-diphosphate farnesyltransferase
MVDQLAPFGIDLAEEECRRPWAYSEFMLEKVSRTFALNIQVLSPSLKRSILLGYLFCRMADTVEDEPGMPGARKRDLLELFRAIFAPGSAWKERAAEFAATLPENWRTSQDPNAFLTAHPEWPLGLLMDGDPRDLIHVGRCVDTMSQGMAEFALRQATGVEWVPLQTVAELDRYCYFVAGTVGEMLTELFSDHSPLISPARREKLRARSVDFGLGLQLVNILKDAAEDSVRGICYIPEELTARHGITTAQLLDPAHKSAAMAAMRELTAKALTHLDAAFAYTLDLPRLEPRMRLFCLWPLFMAAATLAEVAASDRVLSQEKVKISRAQVKSIVRNTTLTCASNFLLRRQYHHWRRLIVQRLEATP